MFAQKNHSNRQREGEVGRMNPAPAGVMPENAAGFGDIEKIDRMYTKNEIRPTSQLFLQVNGGLRADRRIGWRERE
jgi:hypothetical protein